MPHAFFTAAALACLLTGTPALLAAQDSTKTRPDSSAMGGEMDHMMGSWKEMNAFHRVLGATWHPASKNDLVPLRVRAKELKAAADAWAASNAPESPATCAGEEVRAAIAKVARDTRGLVAMITAGADDNWLAASLKGVHDSFEVAEKACGGHSDSLSQR
jgi:hypothetical protein